MITSNLAVSLDKTQHTSQKITESRVFTADNSQCLPGKRITTHAKKQKNVAKTQKRKKRVNRKKPQTPQMLDLVHDNFKINITNKVKNL